MLADTELIVRVTKLKGKEQYYNRLRDQLDEYGQRIIKECEELNEILRKKPMDVKHNAIILEIYNNVKHHPRHQI